MPNVPEILAECKKHAESFETQWTLPWYAVGGDKVWGHPLLRVLINLPEAEFDEATIALFGEPSFALRGIALHLVNARKSRRHAERVRAVLAMDDSIQVRALAAAALGALGVDDADRNALAAIPDGSHPEIKKAAIMALRLAKSPLGAPAIVRWMNRPGEDETVKTAAAQALGDLGGDHAAPALSALLTNGGEPDNARAAAADALGKLGGEDAERALSSVRADPRPWVRARALWSLTKIGGVRRIEDVMSALAPSEPWMVRLAATESLGLIGDERARRRAEELLDDGESKIRAEAALVLGKIGVTDTMAVLGRALTDGDLFVRIQATAAIQKLSGRTFGIEKEVGKPQLNLKAIEASIAAARAFVDTL